MATDTGKKKPVAKPTTSRGQKTRQALLDAAEEIFGQKGYDQTSIAMITLKAGVAQGTFYVYFPDKKAVFVELVKELSHSLRSAIAEAVAGQTDRLEIERLGFRAFFHFAHHHRHLYKIVRQAEFVDEQVFRWYYRRFAEGYIRGLSQAIGQGQVRRFDPELLAYCLMGITDFVGMRWVLWTKDEVPEEISEQLLAFIRRGMYLCEEGKQEEQAKGGTECVSTNGSV